MKLVYIRRKRDGAIYGSTKDQHSAGFGADCAIPIPMSRAVAKKLIMGAKPSDRQQYEITDDHRR